MDVRDLIIAVLTPGTPFNRNGHEWRNLTVLIAYSHLPEAEVLDIIAGDLAERVDTKVTPDNRVMVRLHQDEVEDEPVAGTEELEIPLPSAEAPPQVQVQAGKLAKEVAGRVGFRRL